jgi:hypothetical protein
VISEAFEKHRNLCPEMGEDLPRKKTKIFKYSVHLATFKQKVLLIKEKAVLIAKLFSKFIWYCIPDIYSKFICTAL